MHNNNFQILLGVLIAWEHVSHNTHRLHEGLN